MAHGGREWTRQDVRPGTGIRLYRATADSHSILAKDGFAPRQLGSRGDRLAYSNGIIVLADAAAAEHPIEVAPTFLGAHAVGPEWDDADAYLAGQPGPGMALAQRSRSSRNAAC